MYGNAVQKGGARVDVPARRAEFEEATKEAKALGASQSSSRSFPADRVEVARASATDETFKAQDERAADEVQRFAREAPGTSETRYAPPGSRLDIRV